MPIGTDAAYALGEEAFIAGYLAAIDDCTKCDPEEFRADAYRAWSRYEPSEDVKDLIGDA